jgi:tRNA threonylcarbamoyladenosine biosynthesis protein TsaB
MMLLLDTSTPICKLSLVDGSKRFDNQWQADRALAKGLLEYVTRQLHAHKWGWEDITGIGVFEGPGSFTGLRIGLTVMNTVADSELVPIVGTRGENWQTIALDRLSSGEDDHIVMPFYGSEAHITAPRK